MRDSLAFRSCLSALMLSILAFVSACDNGNPELEKSAQMLLDGLTPGMDAKTVVSLTDNIFGRRTVCKDGNLIPGPDGAYRLECTQSEEETWSMPAQLVNRDILVKECSRPNSCFPANLVSIIPHDADGNLLAKDQRLSMLPYGVSPLTLSLGSPGGIVAIYNLDDELIGVVVSYSRPLIPPAFD